MSSVPKLSVYFCVCLEIFAFERVRTRSPRFSKIQLLPNRERDRRSGPGLTAEPEPENGVRSG